MRLELTLTLAATLLGSSLHAQDFHFVSNRGNEPLNFDIYRYLNGNVRPVLVSPDTIEEHPVLSQDGKTLFFHSTAFAPPLVGHETRWLHALDLGTGIAAPVFPGVSHAMPISGKASIFVTEGDEQSISRLALPSGNRLAHLDPSGTATIGDVAVTGVRVYYSSDQDGDFEIYRADTTFANSSQLTKNSAFDSGATPSPNGSKVAFTSDRLRAAGSAQSDLFVMDADGSNQTLVTRSPNGAGILRPFAWDGNDRIIYVSHENGSADIFSIATNGTNKTLLVGGAADDLFLLPDRIGGGSKTPQPELVATPDSGAPSLPVTLRLTVPPGLNLRRFEWHFGDGGTRTTTTPTTSHTYTTSGAFKVQVVGIDTGKNEYPATTVVQVTTERRLPYQKGLGAELLPPMDLSAGPRNTNLFGFTYGNGRFWTTGQATQPNGFHHLYEYDAVGNLVKTHNQKDKQGPTSPLGLLDLEWNGLFGYGLAPNFIDVWNDPLGNWGPRIQLLPPVPNATGLTLIPQPLGQSEFLISDGSRNLFTYDMNGRRTGQIQLPIQVHGVDWDPYGHHLWVSAPGPMLLAFDILDPRSPDLLLQFPGEMQIGGQPGAIDFELLLGQPTLFGVQNANQDILIPFVADYEFGGSCVGGSGQTPGIGFHGGPFVPGNNNLVIDFFGAQGATIGVPFLAGNNTDWLTIPLPIDLGNGCNLLVPPTLLLPPLSFDPLGNATMPLPLPPDPKLRGVQLMTQALVLDPRAPGGFTTSRGGKAAIK